MSLLHPESWGALLVLGLVIAAVGLLAMLSTFVSGLATVYTYGFLLVAAGLSEVIAAFRHRHSARFVLYLLGGVLSGVVGLFFLIWPLAGLAALSFLIIGYFFVTGLFYLVTSIVDRYAHWGWDFTFGAAAVVVGFIAAAQWPISAMFLVGWLVGVVLFLRGLTLIAGSIELRRFIHRHAEVR